MVKSMRMQNTAGYGKDILDAVAHKSSAQAKSAAAIALVKKDDAKLIEKILDTILASQLDSDSFLKSVSIKNNNIILGRIATLLNEVLLEQSEDASFNDEQVEQLKESILKIIEAEYPSGLATHTDVKSVENDDDDRVNNAIIDSLVLLSNERKKDAQDIKDTFDKLFSFGSGEGAGSGEGSPSESNEFGNKKVESLDDETEGDYQDSTIAQNFQVLQGAIGNQLEAIDNNVKSLTGFSVLGGFVGFATKGIGSILLGVKSVTGKVTSLTKNVVSKVLNISKAIGSGALTSISKTLRGITKGVGLAAGLIGKLGKGISAGFSKIGSGIKSFGSKVGGAIAHPFKAIGSFFGKKKADKAAAKKEKMREKFMDFIMNMMEKIWNFVEPILNKLKIFMLLALVPILTTALTVIAIIAGLALLIIGAILVYKWAKKKIMEFIDYVTSGQLWEDIKAKMLAAWEWMKDFGKWIWNKLIDFGKILLKWYLRALKFIYIDIPVWIWKKLVQFGKYLYDTWIYPYMVQPINDHIIKPLKELWDTKIWPIIQPFVESIQNLVARIKSIWANFKWDENKSFLDNLADFWDQCWSAIRAWWEQSPIKQYWDMLVNYVKDLLKPLREWYEKSKLKEWIDKIGSWLSDIFGWIKAIYDKTVGLVKKVADKAKAVVGKTQDKISETYVSSKQRILEIQKELEDPNTSWWKKTKLNAELLAKKTLVATMEKTTDKSILNRKASSIPQQQVSNALGPVNSLNNMHSDNNLELQKAGEEMSTKAAAAEQATQDYRQQQSMIGSQSLSYLHDMREEMRKGFKDPAVVPLPMPYGPQRNAAMMYDEERY